MHAKLDLRVVLEWKIAGSGSVIAAVIRPKRFEIRYRLKTLLAIVSCCGLLCCSYASEREASRKVRRIDAAIESSLRELNPLVTAHFQLENSSNGMSKMSAYLFDGNIVTASVGSVASGPRFVERRIVVREHVDVLVRITPTWYYLFAGRPRVEISIFHGNVNTGNDWFIQKLKESLSNDSIHLENAG